MAVEVCSHLKIKSVANHNRELRKILDLVYQDKTVSRSYYSTYNAQLCFISLEDKNKNLTPLVVHVLLSVCSYN